VIERAATPWRRLDLLDVLLRAADLLREEDPSAALAFVRETAAVPAKYADAAWGTPALCVHLAGKFMTMSTLLWRLGDYADALRLAEQARHLCEELRRAAPNVPGYGEALSYAWERIAKARWALGRRDEALAAFRESATIQRQVFEQERSVHVYRVSLSRCYDKLAYWGEQAGDRTMAASALLEREKLWPGDAEALMECSRDFQKLAEAVAKGQEHLSPQERAERLRYLDESARLKRAAEGVSRRAEPVHPAGEGQQPD
jgi:hypothetical protein